MAKNERTCICCGTKYQYCPHCKKYSNLEPWHFIFHDDNCREIYRAVTAYAGDEISVDTARARLDKCDLSQKDTFFNTIKNNIDKIYATTTVVVEPVVMAEPENTTQENEVKETVTDTVKNTTKSKVSKKKDQQIVK